MSEFSLPQENTTVGDATRTPYSADEWSIDYSASLTGFASRANFGVVLGYDNGTNFSLEVTQKTVASNQIELKIGAAMVRGTLYVNDATLSLTVQPNVSGNPRIDTVILRKDYTAQTIRAVILQGSPAVTPVAPTLTQSATQWEIPLADIAVANGFSTITDSLITPRQQFVNVGDGIYIDGVLNDSGGTLNDGDVVIWKASTAKAVTTTTTANHWRVAGVWRGNTANGAYGRLQQRGYGKVNVTVTNNAGVGSASLTIGTPLVTAATAKYATTVDFRGYPAGANALLAGAPGKGTSMATVGQLMEAPSIFAAATLSRLCLAYIDIRPPRNPAVMLLKETGTADAGTFTSGSWVARTLSIASNGYAAESSSNYVSVAGSTITLQPGRYHIRGFAAGYRVDGHLARLQDTTNAATVVVSTPAYSPSAADSTQSFAELETFLVVEAATNYQLQQRCTTTRATDGLGNYVGFSSESVTFAQLAITRLDEVLP